MAPKRKRGDDNEEVSESASFHSPQSSLTAVAARRSAQGAASNHPAGQAAVPGQSAAPRLPGQAAVRAEIIIPPEGSEPRPKKKRKAPKKKRKTLTSKGRRSIVVSVLASLEAEKLLGSGNSTPAAPSAAASGPPQQQPAAPPSIPAQAEPPAESDPAATCNRGKAWSKADLATLARMAEDPAFLQATLPGHPPCGEPDWEALSRYFGRYSRGGAAVRAQYLSVVRLVKEARREGRKGVHYCDLVQAALQELPGRQGTVFEVQAVLKQRKYASKLDTYKVNSRVQWKKMVGEVLRHEGDLFEAAGKTATGKIVWQLKAGEAAEEGDAAAVEGAPS